MKQNSITVLAIFGDLRLGALFWHRGEVYRKLGPGTARIVGTDTVLPFYSPESVRAAAFLYGG